MPIAMCRLGGREKRRQDPMTQLKLEANLHSYSFRFCNVYARPESFTMIRFTQLTVYRQKDVKHSTSQHSAMLTYGMRS